MGASPGRGAAGGAGAGHAPEPRVSGRRLNCRCGRCGAPPGFRPRRGRPPRALTVVLAVSPMMGHGRAAVPGRVGIGAGPEAAPTPARFVRNRAVTSFYRLPPISCSGASQGRRPRVDPGDAAGRRWVEVIARCSGRAGRAGLRGAGRTFPRRALGWAQELLSCRPAPLGPQPGSRVPGQTTRLRALGASVGWGGGGCRLQDRTPPAERLREPHPPPGRGVWRRH